MANVVDQVLKETHGEARSTTVPPRRNRANSLDGATYGEARERKEAQRLREEWTQRLHNISGNALYYPGVRRNTTMRAFLDVAREYDQLLLHLEFHQLAEPAIGATTEMWNGAAGPPLWFLPGDYAPLMASLHRCGAVLASAGWRVRRYVDLCAIHSASQNTGLSTWSNLLRRFVDRGKLKAELQCLVF
ncbi:hypothetical protein AAE478_002843 [Parahypoxylon ruwenzoriense]